MSRDTWMKDSNSPYCYGCEAQFTILYRRHHCRRCGRVFCGKCTQKSVPARLLGTSGRITVHDDIDKVRTCDICYEETLGQPRKSTSVNIPFDSVHYEDPEDYYNSPNSNHSNAQSGPWHGSRWENQLLWKDIAPVRLNGAPSNTDLASSKECHRGLLQKGEKDPLYSPRVKDQNPTSQSPDESGSRSEDGDEDEEEDEAQRLESSFLRHQHRERERERDRGSIVGAKLFHVREKDAEEKERRRLPLSRESLVGLERRRAGKARQRESQMQRRYERQVSRQQRGLFEEEEDTTPDDTTDGGRGGVESHSSAPEDSDRDFQASTQSSLRTSHGINSKGAGRNIDGRPDVEPGEGQKPPMSSSKGHRGALEQKPVSRAGSFRSGRLTAGEESDQDTEDVNLGVAPYVQPISGEQKSLGAPAADGWQSDLDNKQLWVPPPPEEEEVEPIGGFLHDEEEDEDEGTAGWVANEPFSPSTSSANSSEGSKDGRASHDETRLALRAVVDGHFRALVEQMLKAEELEPGEEGAETVGWAEVVTRLALKAASLVKPDTSKEGACMDPGGYVKVKCVATGSCTDSYVVKGVVCRKNVAHRRMESKIDRPHLLFLGGALEYQRVFNQLSSMDILLKQEDTHLKHVLGQIERKFPKDRRQQPLEKGSNNNLPEHAQRQQQTSRQQAPGQQLLTPQAASCVLLVEKTVSGVAQEWLVNRKISLVLNVKRELLERIACCTGGQVGASAETLTTAGHCKLFRTERFVENLGSAGHPEGKKLTKTLMFFEGCPEPLGCTVLLMGAHGDQLKKVKRVVQFAVFAAYHLALETSFLADEGAIPESKPQTSISRRHSLEEESSVFPLELSPPTTHGELLAKEMNGKWHTGDSGQDTRDGHFPTVVETVSSEKQEEVPQQDLPGLADVRDYREEAQPSAGLRTVLTTVPPLLPVKTFSGDEGKPGGIGEQNGKVPQLTVSLWRTRPIDTTLQLHAERLSSGQQPKNSLINAAAATGRRAAILDEGKPQAQASKELRQQQQTAPLPSTLLVHPASSSGGPHQAADPAHGKVDSNLPPGSFSMSPPLDASISAPNGTLPAPQAPAQSLVPSSPSDEQTILVSFSVRCLPKKSVCVAPHLVRIKYYRDTDMPLARFMMHNLFNKEYRCKCEMPSEAHVRMYTHKEGSLTISVRQLSLPLPGGDGPEEKDHKLWMWHRCNRCQPVNGVAPVTRRVVMSDAACKLSFGKFLELSFSNHAAASRVAACGHSLHRDCLRFYGCGNMIAGFTYAPIKLHTVHLPPARLVFASNTQLEWLDAEFKDVADRGELVFTEVLNMLAEVGERLACNGSSSASTPEARRTLAYYEGLFRTEKASFDERLQLASQVVEGPAGHQVADILELNVLRRELYTLAGEWERRLQTLALNSHQPRKPTPEAELPPVPPLEESMSRVVSERWGDEKEAVVEGEEMQELVTVSVTDADEPEGQRGEAAAQSEGLGGQAAGHGTDTVEDKEAASEAVGEPLDGTLERELSLSRGVPEVDGFGSKGPTEAACCIKEPSEQASAESAGNPLADPTLDSSSTESTLRTGPSGKMEKVGDATASEFREAVSTAEGLRQLYSSQAAAPSAFHKGLDGKADASVASAPPAAPPAYSRALSMSSLPIYLGLPKSMSLESAISGVSDASTNESINLLKSGSYSSYAGSDGGTSGQLEARMISKSQSQASSTSADWGSGTSADLLESDCDLRQGAHANVQEEYLLKELPPKPQTGREGIGAAESHSLSTAKVKIVAPVLAVSSGSEAGSGQLAQPSPRTPTEPKKAVMPGSFDPAAAVPDGGDAGPSISISRSGSALNLMGLLLPQDAPVEPHGNDLLGEVDLTRAGALSSKVWVSGLVHFPQLPSIKVAEKASGEVGESGDDSRSTDARRRIRGGVGALEDSGEESGREKGGVKFGPYHWRATSHPPSGTPSAASTQPNSPIKVEEGDPRMVSNLRSASLGRQQQPAPLMSSRLASKYQGDILLPLGVDGRVIAVYEDEPTSMIAYAISSVRYLRDLTVEAPTARSSRGVVNSGNGPGAGSGGESGREGRDGLEREGRPREGKENGGAATGDSDSARHSATNLAGSPDEHAPAPWHPPGESGGDANGSEGPAGTVLGVANSEGNGKSSASLKQSPMLSSEAFHITFVHPDEPTQARGGKRAGMQFQVRVYYARQFEALRQKCCGESGTDVDFVRSLCRCRKWEAQGGKSSVYFAKTMDDRLVIKQLQKKELMGFLEFATDYFKYLSDTLSSGSPTCLAKILGIYQVTTRGQTMDLMVMENVLHGRTISCIYDLKGSMRSRYNPDVKGKNKVLLDENLIEAMPTAPIFVGPKAKHQLERAVWNDTAFLAGMAVMDYSLLVGVDEDRRELVVGIIDFIRPYTWDKQLETWVKTSGILGGAKNMAPTVISPNHYKKRFRKAMATYFVMVPDQCTPPPATRLPAPAAAAVSAVHSPDEDKEVSRGKI